MATNQIQRFGQKMIRLVGDYSHNISIKRFSKYLQQIFTFPIISEWKLLSCHSNQSCYPTGTKTQLFVPLVYRCYMRNLVRIGFMTSEEMPFENVDRRRTTDAWLYYKLSDILNHKFYVHCSTVFLFVCSIKI